MDSTSRVYPKVTKEQHAHVVTGMCSKPLSPVVDSRGFNSCPGRPNEFVPWRNFSVNCVRRRIILPIVRVGKGFFLC